MAAVPDKPTMRIVRGNILDVVQPGQVLAHQVNCRQVAGAGLARQIRHKYPRWYENFRSREGKLGGCATTIMEDEIVIADLYAQENYGRNGNSVFTDYSALYQSLVSLKFRVEDPSQILFPYKMGCGLAGGDWNIVFPIVYGIFPHATLVKLP